MDYELEKGFIYYVRDLQECIEYLLRQRAYAADLVYAPIREFGEKGQRIYTEMHTADWWWDVQVRTLFIHYWLRICI